MGLAHTIFVVASFLFLISLLPRWVCLVRLPPLVRFRWLALGFFAWFFLPTAGDSIRRLVGDGCRRFVYPFPYLSFFV
jgi:hypothetical protein